MEILAESCVHTDVVDRLRESGFSVKRAQEVGLANSPDEEIFDFAFKNSLVLLTFDLDFGNILRFKITESAGVVVFHIIEGLSKETIIKRVVSFFSLIKERELKGRLFIIDPGGRIRCWPKK